jgi:hypothetical protein
MSDIEGLYRKLDGVTVTDELALPGDWALPERKGLNGSAAPWHSRFEEAVSEIASELWRPGWIACAFALAVVVPGVLWAIVVGMGLGRLG